MRVKVCGVRRVADALDVARLGVDAVGLLVGQRHRSEDFLDPDDAREIVKVLPPLVSPVLVTHIEDGAEVAKLALRIGVVTIQMHSDCDVRAILRVRSDVPSCKIIRAVHVTSRRAIDEMKSLEDYVDAFVVDSVNLAEDRVGGTGLTHDWAFSRLAVQEVQRPIILAGGLNPTNVADAISTVRPYGVDANTGLRDGTGFKDLEKVAAFVREAKRAFVMFGGDRGAAHEPERDDR